VPGCQGLPYLPESVLTVFICAGCSVATVIGLLLFIEAEAGIENAEDGLRAVLIVAVIIGCLTVSRTCLLHLIARSRFHVCCNNLTPRFTVCRQGYAAVKLQKALIILVTSFVGAELFCEIIIDDARARSPIQHQHTVFSKLT
jgi:ascorbate-specific PTS system EIIC-type component UlaA